MIERVTSLLELLGIALLTAAAGLATFQRFGLPWALVAVAVACFAWAVLLELLAGRRNPEADA